MNFQTSKIRYVCRIKMQVIELIPFGLFIFRMHWRRRRKWTISRQIHRIVEFISSSSVGKGVCCRWIYISIIWLQLWWQRCGYIFLGWRLKSARTTRIHCARWVRKVCFEWWIINETDSLSGLIIALMISFLQNKYSRQILQQRFHTKTAGQQKDHRN